MRKLILAALLVTAAPLASADNCRDVHTLAKSVMEHRQGGVMSVVDMMEIAAQHKASERAFFERVILKAYKHPHYSTPDYQRRAASDFANEMYLACQR